MKYLFNKIRLKKEKRFKYQKGFTLLETMIAIFILTLAITGPIYISSLAIKASVESRDTVTAHYLAQEAIEVIRNNRDTNALNLNMTSSTNPNNWLDNITGVVSCINNPGDTATICKLEKNDNDEYIFTICTTICPKLTFDKNGNDIIYGSVSSIDNSKFTRTIYLQKVTDSNDEIIVNVKISWNHKGANKQIIFKENLYNQQYGKYFQNN